jgi:hypothetical protein
VLQGCAAIHAGYMSESGVCVCGGESGKTIKIDSTSEGWFLAVSSACLGGFSFSLYWFVLPTQYLILSGHGVNWGQLLSVTAGGTICVYRMRSTCTSQIT